MARCYICEKSTSFGKQVSMSRSHVSGRSNKAVRPNLKRIRITENGVPKRVYICTSCLRSNLVTRS